MVKSLLYALGLYNFVSVLPSRCQKGGEGGGEGGGELITGILKHSHAVSYLFVSYSHANRRGHLTLVPEAFFLCSSQMKSITSYSVDEQFEINFISSCSCLRAQFC